MPTRGTLGDSFAIVPMTPNTSLIFRPLSRARVYDAWTTGPSAMGSLYGKPISIRLAPARTMARAQAAVVAVSGSPAVRNGMNALRPSLRRRANTSAMRPIRFLLDPVDLVAVL